MTVANCGTCDFWKQNVEKFPVSGKGYCEWPGPIPIAMTSHSRCAMRAVDGADCQCWVHTVQPAHNQGEKHE